MVFITPCIVYVSCLRIPVHKKEIHGTIENTVFGTAVL